MSRIDEQIKSLELHLNLLQYTRKKLDRDIVENRQAQAETRNQIKKLKEERRRANE